MNKKSARKPLMILCCVLLGMALFAVSAAAAVHSLYTNIGGSGPFSFSDYRKLDTEQLDYEGSGISDLRGIERCKELRELSVSGCDVADFSPLYKLEKLERLNCLGSGITTAQYDELRSALPGCEIIWDVPFRGGRVRADSVESLSLTDDDAAELGILSYFPRLSHVDLNGCTFTPEMKQLIASMPDCDFSWSVELFGKTFTGDDKLIDLNEIKVDLDELCSGLEHLPFAEQVELCDSGLSNEQMERLMVLFPEKKFVWKIYLGNWSLRTDVTNFSTGHVGFTMSTIPNSEGQQLKYCRDLVALDLGHNRVHDLSFISGLTKLRSLIIVDTTLNDLTPLMTLKNLEYVELFQNEIVDISPLAALENVRELNITKNRISDFTPLYGLKKLEKLWVGINNITPAAAAELKAHVPEGCKVVWDMASGDHPCAYGWRPIDYRTWGFRYDQPLNIGMIERMEAVPYNLSGADIDPEAYRDEPLAPWGETASD